MSEDARHVESVLRELARLESWAARRAEPARAFVEPGERAGHALELAAFAEAALHLSAIRASVAPTAPIAEQRRALERGVTGVLAWIAKERARAADLEDVRGVPRRRLALDELETALSGAVARLRPPASERIAWETMDLRALLPI